MAKTVTVKLSGIEDLERKMLSLPAKFVQKGLRSSLRGAAVIWRDEMQATAQRLTGWLASQFIVRVKLSKRDEAGTAKVGPSGKQDPARLALKRKHTPSAANEAVWEEFGVPAHGIAPNPVIRRAFDSKGREVLDRFTELMREKFIETFGHP